LKKSAKTEDRAVAGAKLVALGVSAKVVVIVEDKDAGFVARGFAEIVAAASPLMPPPTTTRS